MKKFAALIVTILSFNICIAQLVINADNTSYRNLGREITYLEDSTGNLTFEDVSNMPENLFSKGKDEIFNGGTAGKTFWIKLSYQQAKEFSPFLVLGYGNVDFIDIYYSDSQNNIKHIQSGTFKEKDTRAFETAEFIFELNDVGGNVKEIYIRAKSVNTLLLPIKLTDYITLSKALIKKYLSQLFYVGITFSIFLFYLLMYISTKKGVYGFYLLRIFFLFYLYILAYLNSYAHFFNIQVGKFVLIHAQAFAALGFIATIYFDRAFLHLKEKKIRNRKWSNILITSWLFLLLLSCWDTRFYTNRIVHVLLLATSVLILYNCIRTIQQTRNDTQNRYLTFYLIAWLPTSFATIYVVTALLKIIPVKDYIFEVLNIACLLEAVLMSIAILGDRLNFLKKGKEQAEMEMFEVIKERNNYLELKIEERTRELKSTNDELTASNEFKDKLFSIIAHDMRTPLSSLKMVLQLADGRDIPKEMLHILLDNIRKNTEQVQKMMDNLLNWSISQMKLQHYEPQRIDAKEFLQEHLAIYTSLAENKSIKTSLQCNQNLVFYADKNQLSLIIRNLIDNAIKFTPQNGTLELAIEDDKDSQTVYVRNSGEPISPSTIDRILGNQHKLRVTSYGTAQEKGAGLGLQLCKEFLSKMNSELQISNEVIDEKNFAVFSFKIQKN